MTSMNSTTNDTGHMRKMVTIWLILSVAADLLFWFLVGPHVPPGRMTETAKGDQLTFNVLMVGAMPVLIGVWVFLGYSIVTWSAKRNGPEPLGGEAAKASKGVQVAWISITTVLVLVLAAYGSIALILEHGSGSGEGPNPVWMPNGAAKAETAALAGTGTWTPGSNNVLPVQVIAQQWKFTYRYPTFGGFESSQLIVPNDATIAFNVTSLDVIHSFWAYQLGVKADANPSINDVAFTETKQTGQFVVRCSELCGIWHGAMFNYGNVVSQQDFMNWATSAESANSANTKNLPPFAWTYVPDANGASGGYYPDGNVTPYSSVQIYGAKQPVS